MNVYSERANVVAALIAAAESKGWECCWWVDPAQGLGWPVVCLNLPTGQATFHLAQADFERLGLERLKKVEGQQWDGHSTEDKYQRIADVDWNAKPQVNHPSHYNHGEKDTDGTAKFEPIKVIQDWGLAHDFCIGNSLKYIARAPYKGTTEADLLKAAWYARRAATSCSTLEGPPLPSDFPHEDVSKAWGLDRSLSEVVRFLCTGKYGEAADALEAHVLAIRGQ